MRDYKIWNFAHKFAPGGESIARFDEYKFSAFVRVCR